MSEKTGNQYRTTSFRNGGRRAGTGISCDDYSEESYGGCNEIYCGVKVRLPHDGIDPESLNGPVVIVKSVKESEGNG